MWIPSRCPPERVICASSTRGYCIHRSPPSQENIKKIGYDQKPELRVFWPDIPKDHTKYVIYWDACNAAMVDDFLRNSVKRAQGEPEGMTEHRSRPAAFTRILSLRYPDDFPATFVAAASRCNIGVASLQTQEAAFYKRKARNDAVAASMKHSRPPDISMEVVALICARGGSKGLPGKNIRPLGGPTSDRLGNRTGAAVPRIGRIIVSTDSEQIAAVAREAGAEVPFMRPGGIGAR